MTVSAITPEEIWHKQFSNALKEENQALRETELDFAMKGAVSHNLVFDVASNYKHLEQVRRVFGQASTHLNVVERGVDKQYYLKLANESRALRGLAPL